jgi:hypothetical protein
MEGRNYMHPNPMFDLLSGWVPHRLKDLFRWCEYMYFNSAHISVAASKRATYVVTDVNIKSDADALVKKYRDIADNHVKLKARLIEVANNTAIYGNVFISVHAPLSRTLACPVCSTSRMLHTIQGAKYEHKTRMISAECVCGHTIREKIDELPTLESKDYSELQITMWDPKYIEIDCNPITGERRYWYEVPPDVRDRIVKGDMLFVARMPIGFLVAVSERKMFEFQSDKILHLRSPAPAGMDPTWGYPPLASALKTFYNIAVLTRANEAIALDHLIPFRIISPQQTGTSVDPAATINMAKWASKVQTGYLDYRNDPLHLIFAPMGVNVSQINGQGRALLTLSEVEARENQLLAVMGIPREFMYGSLQTQASPIGLRMFENETESAATDIRICGQWIMDKITSILGDPRVETTLAPFKFIDDVQQKLARVQVGQELGILSKTTIAEEHSIDLVKERDRQLADAMDDARHQGEMQRAVDKITNDYAQQATDAARQGVESQAMPGLNYDQQQVVAQADMVAQELAQLDPSTRRSRTDALQSEDYVMYSVVTMRLRQMETDAQNQAMAQMQQQQPVM